jgi:ComF family protein
VIAREAAAALAHGVLDLLFAPVCLGCDQPISPAAVERLVCAVCWSRARELPRPSCERCGSPRPAAHTPLPERESCPTCDLLPPYLRAVRSAYLMEGPPRKLVHALKYGGWRAVAGEMGRRMAALPLPQEVREEVDLVVPVPVAKVRLRARGYNQAEMLARSLAAARGWRHEPEIMERTRATESQTALHPTERRANVAGAFRVRAGREEKVRREHVLLVDDVWTTGATALACAAALTAAGARAVSVITFARALPDRKL